MKLLKKIALLSFSVALVACGDDDSSSGPSYTLTDESIVGTYVMNSLEGESSEATTLSTGSSVEVSSSEVEGDTFDEAQLILSLDGTYSTSGSYVLTIDTTVEGETETITDIVNLGSSGTYVLNTENETINFTVVEAGTDVVFEGMFNINDIDEDELELSNISTEESGSNTITSETTYGFEREVEEEE